MRNSTKTLTALAVAGGVLAAGADGARAQATGTWTLAEVDGQALPAVVDRDGCTEEVTEGTLTLGGDGRWTLAVTERETCDGEVDEEREDDDGRYTVEGVTIRFLDGDGDPIEDEMEDDDEEGVDVDVEQLGVGTLGDGAMSVRLADGRTTLTFRR